MHDERRDALIKIQMIYAQISAPSVTLLTVWDLQIDLLMQLA